MPSRSSRSTDLDALLAQVEAIILARQDPDTGLLPASTAVTVHGDYTHAWVRDNVYSILAVWALARALARRGDLARARPLDGHVVRLMRGLLAAMMRQAPKVERFKHTQHPLDALHAKYDTRRGEPVVGDGEWGHLQLDATAVFLLFLAQMSAGGLAIVQTPGEVAFVQNLVHYLAPAYRTPDYGIWERGHKGNLGIAEVNGSSVGMAKAALEAIDGLEFLPGIAPAIHVLHDDIAHARHVLEGLLPRESESKETDAALLSVIGWPAFAVDDAALVERTRGDIVGKLQGRYGCKRFLRDGHQTVPEDHSRLHYEPGELSRFEHIESEWPLFFAYLQLDAALRGDDATAADYRARLLGLRQRREGQWLLPELYVVPPEAVEAERAAPHSQARVPNANLPLVWAQSLHVVAELLHAGLVTPDDIDPLRRRARRAAAPSLAVALVADDPLVQARLAANGLVSQTAAQCAPLRLRDQQELKQALAALGRSDALGLGGRPPHRLGSLATSCVWQLGGERSVVLPALCSRQGFYLTLDNRLFVDELMAEIAYVRRHARGDAPPLIAVLVTAAMLDAQGADGLIDALRALAEGREPGVQCGRLATLARDALTCTIDWLPAWPEGGAAAAAAQERVEAALVWEEAATRPLTPARAARLAAEADERALEATLLASRNPYEQVEVLGLLWDRRGADARVEPLGTLRQLATAVYTRAGRQRQWGLLRRAAGLLGLADERLEDAVETIVVHRKRVSVGRGEWPSAVLARPLGQDEIVGRLAAEVQGDRRAAVLVQESVLLLATLMRAQPAAFADLRTLRPWRLVRCVADMLAREHGLSDAEAADHVLDLSPQALLGRLREVLQHEGDAAAVLAGRRRIEAVAADDGFVQVRALDDDSPAPGGDWTAWRRLRGAVLRLPEGFCAEVWALLSRCDGVVIGNAHDDRHRLDSALLRADTTPGELSFARQLEDVLNQIDDPAWRELSLEALSAAAELLRANPTLHVDGRIVVDTLLADAVAEGWGGAPAAEEAGAPAGADPTADAWARCYASTPQALANAVIAAFEARLRARPVDDAPAEEVEAAPPQDAEGRDAGEPQAADADAAQDAPQPKPTAEAAAAPASQPILLADAG